MVFKRGIDIVGSSLALVGLAPIMAVVALLVRFRLGRPVIFRQRRSGLNGAPFTLLKFRTMLDGDGSDAERLTKFGTRLRASSLDELPELVNVLRGEMSLVGPRPLLTEYLPLYNDYQRQRFKVRPGLTGLAQANGRNSLDWDERLDIDVNYVTSLSIWLDLKIILMTVRQLASRSGVAADGEATMQRFTGSKPRPSHDWPRE